MGADALVAVPDLLPVCVMLRRYCCHMFRAHGGYCFTLGATDLDMHRPEARATAEGLPHLVLQWILAELEVDHFTSGALSGFAVEGGAGAPGGPEAFAFPAGTRIVEAA